MNSIIAIARTVLKETVRMRVFMAFMLLTFLTFSIFFALWLGSGTGRPDEKVQTLMSYGTSGIIVVLSLSTLFLSVATVTRDIKRCEIFTIATKPVSRLNYLFGKFVGIMTFNIVMLLAALAGMYYSADYLAKSEIAKAPVTEQEYFKARIDSLVLSARKGVFPNTPSFEQQVKNEVERMVEEQLQRYPDMKKEPQLIDNMRKKLTASTEASFKKGFSTVVPGGYKVFDFHNIKVFPGDKYIYIRYKMDVSWLPDSQKVFGQWMVGPTDPTLNKTEAAFQTYDIARTFHEQRIPAELVSPEGDLYIAFRNPFENESVSILFPDKDGIEVLYTADSFISNFSKAFILILLRLTYLTVLSLAFGVLLSYSVSILVVTVFFIIGLCSNFILDAVFLGIPGPAAVLIQTIMSFLPHLAEFDPSVLLEKGRYIEPGLILKAFINMVLFKGFGAGILGYLAFRKKELARVIV